MVPGIGAPKLPTGNMPEQGQKFSIMDIISALLSGKHDQAQAGTGGNPDIDPSAMPATQPTPMPSPTPGPSAMAPPPMGAHPQMQLAMAKQGMPNPMEHDEEKPGMKRPMGRRV